MYKGYSMLLLIVIVACKTTQLPEISTKLESVNYSLR